MNRFGIKITRTYWVTLGLAFLAVFAFSLLAVFFPSSLWFIASALAIVFFGKIAAKSCYDKKNGFPIGRAFIWSYISFTSGRWAASLLSTLVGWREQNTSDYIIRTFFEGDMVMESIDTIINRLTDFLQSPEAIFGFEFVHIMYSGIIISLITGIFIKINK